MTKEEFDKILDSILPQVVGGMVRPKEPIPTDLPFSTEFRQLLQVDMNLANHENAFLRQLFSNDKLTDEAIKAIRDQLASCDLRLVTQVLKGLMSPPDKIKLDGIQAGALNNPHPATHPATILTLDAQHRFATDAEKAAWNAKANASHGIHVPATQAANNAIFLRNDDTWQYVTPDNIGAYTKGAIDGAINTLNSSINTKEPAFGKGNAFNKNFGSAAGTVCQGNDSRLSDARPPTAHSHDDRYYTETEVNGLLVGKEPAFAKNNAFNKNFGTAAGTVCQGNDARLADARKNPNALTINLNGANQGAYDGSAAKAINITAANIGATAATMGGIIAGSLAQNGWVKFANGLILQWGIAGTLAGASWAYAYVKFPIAFPTTNYNILATHVGTDTVNVAEKIDEHGTTQTTLLAKNNVGTNLAGWILRWFAIGF